MKLSTQQACLSSTARLLSKRLIYGWILLIAFTAYSVDAVAIKGAPQSLNSATVVASAPTISGLSPASYPASSSNQTMLINGSNFVSGATITYHDPQGTPYVRTPTFVSSSQLSHSFNNGNDPGTWTVFVTNPNGQTSNTWNFTVTAAAPVISGLSPASYPTSSSN